MRQAALDGLDRFLLVALRAGGYVFSAITFFTSLWLGLSGLGALEKGWAFARAQTEPVVVWVGVLCLLAASPLGWLFSRDIVPPIAKQDPADRPALREVTVAVGKLASWMVAFKAFKLLVLGDRDGSGTGRFVGAALLFVACLALVGVNALAERWPFARPKTDASTDPSRAEPRSRILLP